MLINGDSDIIIYFAGSIYGLLCFGAYLYEALYLAGGPFFDWNLEIRVEGFLLMGYVKTMIAVPGMYVMAIMGAVWLAECRDPVLHYVGGGRFSWQPTVNFTRWSIHQHFYVGDWLYFGFDRHIYNVLEVNKTSYDKCWEREYIRNITRGGRDVFNLTEARTYYFLSGRGFCTQGMKVEVRVVEYVVHGLPPTNNDSTSSTLPLTTNGVPLLPAHTALLRTLLAGVFFLF